jgi:DsbC/DsbD-like thiol-disulfide interchange protein
VQLVQLQEAKAGFEAQGYKVAALSYDPPGLLDEFARRKGLTYPLISDPDSLWLASAGLLNTEATGMLKGVSLPATLVVDSDRKVAQIYAESAYQDRITPAYLLEILKGAEPPQAKAEPAPTQPTVKVSQSDARVTAGSLFSVAVTVALPAGYHLYAPGTSGPVPVSLSFKPHPLLDMRPVRYPDAHEESLLGEKVMVYVDRTIFRAEGKVRAGKEVRDQLPELGTLPLRATLEYQCCTESLCLAPAKVELEWSFDYLPLDLDRSPEPLQHR